MNKLIVYTAFAFILSFGYSCSRTGIADVDKAQKPLVTVMGKTLYESDLSDLLSQSYTKEDSAKLTEAYIKTWVNDQLMYNKAKKNLVNEKEIETLVDNYRKSLIINSYQEQLLSEQLSKSISDADLRAFYEEHKDQFKLDDAIIKGLYLKVPATSPSLANFQRWYRQTTDDAKENIEKNTLQNAVGYEYFYDKWISFTDVMDNIPQLITNNEEFLKNNKSLEVSDSSFVYLLNIKEYKLAGGEPPFEYIKAKLTEVFMEQRKADYLRKVQQDLYNKALSDEEIKFYNK